MAKLVRARPKLPEFLPEWRKCCPEMMALRDSIGDLILDMEDIGTA